MIIWKESTIKEGVVFFLMLVIAGFCLAEDNQEVSAVGKKISSIETAGNVSISRSKIISRIRARVGEKFDEDSASEDVKRIAKIDGVKYSYYNTVVNGDQVKLTYVVNEKNLIRSMEFAGIKGAPLQQLMANCTSTACTVPAWPAWKKLPGHRKSGWITRTRKIMTRMKKYTARLTT